jgi:hypothetical protein
MGTLGGIIAALQAIPTILSMLKELLEYLNKATGNDIAGYIKNSKEAIEELKKAKTEKEKLDAAKKIQNLITKL